MEADLADLLRQLSRWKIYGLSPLFLYLRKGEKEKGIILYEHKFGSLIIHISQNKAVSTRLVVPI